MKKKKNSKSKGLVNADGERWYNSIDPGIDTTLGSAIYNGPGILFRLATGVERDTFAPEHEENLWRAYTMGGTDGLPKSKIRFDGEDLGDADVVGLPKEQAFIVQAVADTLYADQMRKKVRGYTDPNLWKQESMRRKAMDYQELSRNIINNPGEWVLVGESSSPVRKTSGSGDRQFNYSGLGGLKNFYMRWNPDDSTLDVKDEYDFKDEGVEGNIPRRDRRLFIRDKIKFNPKKGSRFYRNPEMIEELGYKSRFGNGGLIDFEPEDGISLYYIPAMDDGGDTNNDKKPGFWEKAGNVMDAIIHPKDAAYAIMRASNARASLSPEEVFSIIVNGRDGDYTGGANTEDPSFDYPHMYIYGEARGAEELTDEEKGYGVDYSSYIRSTGRDPNSVKQYRGDFGTDIILPESYRDVISNMIDSGNNKTFGFYGNSGKDNIAGHLGRINRDKNGNYIMSYSDIWDFEPGSYTKKWGDGDNFRTYVQSWLLDKVGTPFIVRSNKNIEFVPDDEFYDRLQEYGHDDYGHFKNFYSRMTRDGIERYLSEKSKKEGENSSNSSSTFGDAFRIITTPFRSMFGLANGGYVAERDNTSIGGPGISERGSVYHPTEEAKSNSIIPFVAGILPVIGDVIDAADFIQAASDRNALGMALAAAGFIPMIGDATQEYFNILRNSAPRTHINKSLGRIKESDDELLDKMPDYANPDSPYKFAIRNHKSRIESGGYERITGRSINSEFTPSGTLEVEYPGIYKGPIDATELTTKTPNIREMLELNFGMKKGTLSNATDEEVGMYLDAMKNNFYYDEGQPLYEAGRNGESITFIDKWALDNKFPGYTDELGIPFLSHELDHGVYRNSPELKKKMEEEGVEDWFDINEVDANSKNYFNNPLELSARGTQIKDYFGLTDDSQKITPEMLKYAARHYAETWPDNGMIDFFSGIKNWDKAAKWINKYSTVTIPSVMVSRFLEDGEANDERKKADEELVRKMGGSVPKIPSSDDGSSPIYKYRPSMFPESLYKRKKYIVNRLSSYGIGRRDSEDIVDSILPFSLLDDKYYNVKNKSYGIGQWSGDDLKEFVMTYRDGGLTDQIDFIAKKYFRGSPVRESGFSHALREARGRGDARFSWNGRTFDTEEKRHGGALFEETGDIWTTGLDVVRTLGDGGLVERQDHVYERLTEDYNMPPLQAVAIIANLTAESGLDPLAEGDSGQSVGIQQWKGERRKRLEAAARKNGDFLPSLDDQIDFLMSEYTGGGFQFRDQGRNLYADGKVNNSIFDYYQYSKGEFDNADNLWDATIAWNQGVGRPNKKFAANEKRFKIAQEIADRHGVKYNETSRYDVMGPLSVPPESIYKEKDEANAVQVQENGSDIEEREKEFMSHVEELLSLSERKSGNVNIYINDSADVSKSLEADDLETRRRIAESEQREKERRLIEAVLPGIQLNIKTI